MNIDKINQRLDSIDDLIKFQYECDLFRSRIAKLPDLEKLLARIFSYSIKHKVRAIYFEDVSLIKLKEFKTLLKTFKELPEIIETLGSKADEFKSSRLRQLVIQNKEESLFPTDILSLIK